MNPRPVVQVLLLGFAFAGFSCSSGTKINVAAGPGALTNTEMDAIVDFVVLIDKTPDEDVSSLQLYPGDCLGTDSGGDCLKGSGCGYTADRPTFNPSIPCDAAACPDGIEVTLCARDDDNGIVAAGQTTVLLDSSVPDTIELLAPGSGDSPFDCESLPPCASSL